MKNILVVAAHPDDEVLGAGGTIARHTDQGDQVTIMILGRGIAARYNDPSPDILEGSQQTRQLSQIIADAGRAARLLGVSDQRFFDLPDNRFDSTDLLEVVKKVEGIVDEVQPELVYTHFEGDLNIDHQITARAVMTACRPVFQSPVKKILAFEVPSSTGWGSLHAPFVPTVFMEVIKTLPLKLEAMRAYRSEVQAYPLPRSPEALAERARVWGSQVGMQAAEPFLVLRELIR
jgi:LmbE family N-acetylglucosaminyl deacetylase